MVVAMFVVGMDCYSFAIVVVVVLVLYLHHPRQFHVDLKVEVDMMASWRLLVQMD